jgi:hypothetical protein
VFKPILAQGLHDGALLEPLETSAIQVFKPPSRRCQIPFWLQYDTKCAKNPCSGALGADGAAEDTMMESDG